MYATMDYYESRYLGQHTLLLSELEEHLQSASEKVDSLTYNRIRGIGFEQLTPFQQSVIQEVVCQLADFEIENADVLEMVMSGYSINGVSMSFGENWNVSVERGVAMKRSTWELLKQTGLTRRVI